MELKNVKINFYLSPDLEQNTRMEVIDEDSNTTFLELQFTNEQVVQLLSTRGYISPEKAEVFDLDKVGLIRQDKKYVVRLSDRYSPFAPDSLDIIIDEVEQACPEGWTPNHYYTSQGSCFSKDGEHYVRATYFRWVKRRNRRKKGDKNG